MFMACCDGQFTLLTSVHFMYKVLHYLDIYVIQYSVSQPVVCRPFPVCSLVHAVPHIFHKWSLFSLTTTETDWSNVLILCYINAHILMAENSALHCMLHMIFWCTQSHMLRIRLTNSSINNTHLLVHNNNEGKQTLSGILFVYQNKNSKVQQPCS